MFHPEFKIVRLMFEGGVWSRVNSTHDVIREGCHKLTPQLKKMSPWKGFTPIKFMLLFAFSYFHRFSLFLKSHNYVMWWGHTLAQRHTQPPCIGALKWSFSFSPRKKKSYSRFTYSLPSQSTRFGEQTKVTRCGKKFLVPISVCPISYPLSFTRKVKHQYYL